MTENVDFTADQVTEKLKEKFAREAAHNQSNFRATFSSMNLLNGRIGLPLLVTYDQTTVTGKNKGVVRRKKKNIYFYPNYCPFTGKKIN